MHTANQTLSWPTILKTLRARSPLVFLTGGGSETQLSDWRARAAESGVEWFEPEPTEGIDVDHPFGFWLSRMGPRARGVPATARGKRGAVDLHSPLLPDRFAVYQAISEWLKGSGDAPRVVVLKGFEHAPPDCLEALPYVARSLVEVASVLLLVASRRMSQDCRRVLSQIKREVGLRGTAGKSAARGAAAASSSESAERAFALCRAGAVVEGGDILARLLGGADAPTLPTRVAASAWLYLAMAMTRRRQFVLVEIAARRAMALAARPETYRLSRRVLMAALHQAQRADELHALACEVTRELESKNFSPAEEAHLRLDAALGLSLTGPADLHASILDRLLSLPAASVPRHVLATAHLWRAASDIMAQNPAAALLHQREGLAALETEADHSRALIVRSRLAATLEALGLHQEAARQFESAAQQSLRMGQYLLCAQNIAGAVAARVAAGAVEQAAGLLRGRSRLHRLIWKESPATLLRKLSEARVAYARRRFTVAETLVNNLFDELGADSSGDADWVARFACEGAYVLADITRARGDCEAADEWTREGLGFAEKAAPEECVGLLAAGLRRLNEAAPARDGLAGEK